jgi:hypothetical protein
VSRFKILIVVLCCITYEYNLIGHIPVYFNREPNYVPEQQNNPVQVEPVDHRDNLHHRTGDATYGGQTYFNREPKYMPGQQNYPVYVVPVGHRDGRLQKPDDPTGSGQRNHHMRQPKNS